MQDPTFRLLAATNNARGDLFTRLVKDLFFALGYDVLRLDVQKAGREIDIRGKHRFESREVMAECKAEKAPIGGRDANTFLGVLTRERDRSPGTSIAGYFVSLSGFRETEVEQELETGPGNRIILLKGEDVVRELERSRVLVSREQAIERAGRCLQSNRIDAVLDGAELLGHQIGYVWAVYYAQGKERMHFALIHADGTPLAGGIAKQLVAADRRVHGRLHELTYLAPVPERGTTMNVALPRYAQWIEEECGFIQLDGLPADTDLSATRMKLERLFVPLNVTIKVKEKGDKEREQERSLPLGELLGWNPHLALVGKPGAGKSTLLKRLAVAYATQSRRNQAEDNLPDREWLPLFLRCRELRDRVQRPMLELLDDLPLHAGMTDEEAGAFREHMHDTLRSGKALLLIDGLDEIAEEGARRTFVQHLRTFVAMFPNAGVVVTSREAGFRLIADVVASVCQQARVAPFDAEDVRRLCVAWHVQVVANNEKVRAEARQLAETIWTNTRIRALAENPLLLTTLLVVKRWIGELPTKRVQLYREAVRVLIRTWNTEGFAPLDLDEALAQLSYVAYAMTVAGEQQIGQKALLALLRQARKELVSELQFTEISPEQFVERIEYRSSLLMQTGFDEVDGELQPIYEFRHLTFQEYLAARAIVEEQYPGRDDERSAVELLEPHFGDEAWREIIPLTAVLAGRKAEPVIVRLVAIIESVDNPVREMAVLHQCLLDEIQLAPVTLRAALACIASCYVPNVAPVPTLLRGKFGAMMEEIIIDGYLGGGDRWDRYIFAFSEAVVVADDDLWSEPLLRSLELSLRSEDRVQCVRAALTCMHMAYSYAPENLAPIRLAPEKRAVLRERFTPIRDTLGELVGSDDDAVALAASWALVWIGASRLPRTSPAAHVLLSLYRLWLADQRFAAWAFQNQPLLSRDTFADADWEGADVLFERDARTDALIVLGWYLRRPWSDAELLARLKRMRVDAYPQAWAVALLRELGPEGIRMADEIQEQHHERINGVLDDPVPI